MVWRHNSVTPELIDVLFWEGLLKIKIVRASDILIVSNNELYYRYFKRNLASERQNTLVTFITLRNKTESRCAERGLACAVREITLEEMWVFS